jgi:hypothetical protein
MPSPWVLLVMPLKIRDCPDHDECNSSGESREKHIQA